MGFSPLANMKRDMPAGNRWSQRNSKIRGVTVHHQAGVDAHGQGTAPGREVSAQYWITNNGDIIPQVDEVYRAWTTGSAGYPAGAESDHRNITIEVSNSPEGVRTGRWNISGKAQRALERLIGDIFYRHKLGTVKRGTHGGVAIHRDFVPTECPGPYIVQHLGLFISNAEKYRRSLSGGGSTPSNPSTPTTQGEDDVIYIRRSTQGKVYAYNTVTRQKRAIDSWEWEIIRNAYREQGLSAPVANVPKAADRKKLGI